MKILLEVVELPATTRERAVAVEGMYLLIFYVRTERQDPTKIKTSLVNKFVILEYIRYSLPLIRRATLIF
jgi:hypothetical protein